MRNTCQYQQRPAESGKGEIPQVLVDLIAFELQLAEQYACPTPNQATSIDP
jgi:hypothetical protein